MKKAFYLLVFLMISVVATAQDKAGIKVIEPAQFGQEITSEEVQLIDVRTPEEFEAGHIRGAENIDFLGDDFLTAFNKLDKERPIYIYCRSGNRSAKAAAKLSEIGFKEIIDLKGGYKAWPKEQ